jgi:hypothetical protein
MGMRGEGEAEVYVCQDVADVEALHPYLSDAAFKALPIREQLDRQAQTLLAAHQSGDRRVKPQLGSWWPGAARMPVDAMLAAPFTLDDARLTIAREYGFKHWAAVLATDTRAPDGPFEAAVDALVAGALTQLRRMLDADPGLVHARSCYGHRATLLHYLGANGVETHRQKTPLNAVEIARLLIERGADAEAKADMYGGGQTALGLVETSAHPAAAGIAGSLAALLNAAGGGRR